jgi:putative ABC transport system permease protein
VNNVLDQIESVPGVQAAAVTSYLPLESADGVLSMRIEGQNAKIGMEHGTEIFVRAVSADYFKAMGIPLLAGKSFEPSDSKNSAPVAVVNETFAKTYLSTNVLGCHFSVSDQNGHPQWVEIIGEVANSHDLSLLQKPSAEYYIPSAQSEFFSGANFVVRTGNDPLAIIPAIRQQIWDVDRDAPITNVRTIDQIVAEQVAQPKFRTLLLDAFGVLGLIMAIVGIYGVISHAVTQRTHEIGVRVALGAQPRQVLNMVIAEGMLLAITGVMTGTGGAFALSHFLQSLLFGIKSTDPVSFVFVAVLLMLAAFVACWIPARRATRVNPVDALRCE